MFLKSFQPHNWIDITSYQKISKTDSGKNPAADFANIFIKYLLLTHDQNVSLISPATVSVTLTLRREVATRFISSS